jgi:dipeptidyl aminopeptidase/acylaminoacyl peptidase
VVFSSGHILYVRERSLVAQPFDLQRLQTTGPFVSIAEQELDPDPTFSRSGFTVSDAGVLVFQSTADSSTRLVWFDRTGRELGIVPTNAYSKDPSVSPDGRFLAVSSDDGRNGKYFVRVYDLARDVSTRLTSGGRDSQPIWSRDGKKIAYMSDDGKTFSMQQVAADGSASPQVLTSGAWAYPNDWSPGGQLAFMKVEKGLPFLAIYSATDRSVTPFASGGEAQFSPDGKWVAYIGQGGVAGGGGIVVQPFPGPGPHIQISDVGGAQPRWSRDGTEIFYMAPDRTLMAVAFDSKTGAASATRAVFRTRILVPNLAGFQYDIAPDGRFLVNSFPVTDPSPLTLLAGWTAAH